MTNSRSVDVSRDDGKVLTFNWNGSLWKTDGDVNSKLVKSATGWQYTTGLDEVEIYNPGGKLLSVTDRAGLRLTFSYDAQSRLTAVTNAFNRSLTFAYNGAETRIASVTVPSGGIYVYRYDAKNKLSAVMYPDNTQRQYL